MEFIGRNTIKLCRKGSACCPTVEKTDDSFYNIKDDYNGTVKLNDFEMQELVEAFQKLKNGEQE